MILGAANFGQLYRGHQVPKDEVFKMIEYFDNNGGKLINVARRYNIPDDIYSFIGTTKLKVLWNCESGVNAIYYPHEIRPDMKIISIPNSDLFETYLDVMKLHATVYCRSIFTLGFNSYVYQYCDGSIIGCDNLAQLKDNMERFK